MPIDNPDWPNLPLLEDAEIVGRVRSSESWLE